MKDLNLSYPPQECRKLLSDQHPPIKELVEMGLIPIFVSFLRSKNSKLQFEAAWVLTNICSGTSEQTQGILNNLDFFLQKKKKLTFFYSCYKFWGSLSSD